MSQNVKKAAKCITARRSSLCASTRKQEWSDSSTQL